MKEERPDRLRIIADATPSQRMETILRTYERNNLQDFAVAEFEITFAAFDEMRDAILADPELLAVAVRVRDMIKAETKRRIEETERQQARFREMLANAKPADLDDPRGHIW